MCAQEKGGLANCNQTADATAFPTTFTATKEVKNVTVADAGKINLVLADIGTGTVDKTVVFTPTLNETSITWQIDAASITENVAVMNAFLKNSVATAPQ